VFSRTIDDQVDVVEAGADALVGLARPHLRVHVELLAQADVHRAEASTDRGGDRTFQRNTVLADGLQGHRRERVAVVLLHHVRSGVLDVPVELDARRLEDAPRRFGQLRSRAVAGDQGDSVRHEA
jgi:hypothetical protein